MALENWSLASLADLKAYLGNVTGTTFDENLNQALNEATALVEGRTARQLVSRVEFTEYHSLGARDVYYELWLSEWPIITISTIHEDDTWPRVYGAASLLAAGTDYEQSASMGWVRRLGSAGPVPWKTGSRIVRVVYSAGYKRQDGNPASALAVPYDLKKACLFAAASIYKESDRQRWGVSAVTDAMGSVTRYMGHLTPEIEKDLARYARKEFHRTWEKAA